MSGAPIRLIGGAQEYDIIHVEDVADAFRAMLDVPTECWQPLYTLGSTSTYPLKQMAERAVEVASRFNGGVRSSIAIDEQDIQLKYGLDSTLFYEDMSWRPRYINLDDIIESLVRFWMAET
jgi:nucleoside-diphosphate-sugar epimerase